MDDLPWPSAPAPTPGVNMQEVPPCPLLVNWSMFKPVIGERCMLQTTAGPSTHPDREPNCVICLADILETDATLLHTVCSYAIHADCLQTWLDRQDQTSQGAKCPVCRQVYSLGTEIKEYFSSLTLDLVSLISSSFNLLEVLPADHAHYQDQLQETFTEAALHPLSAALIPQLTRSSPLQTFSDKLDVLYEWILQVVDARVKTIRGQAEDAVVQGTPWPSAREEGDLALKKFETQFLRLFVAFVNFAQTAKAACLKIQRFHLELTTAIPAGELHFRYVRDFATQHVLEHFDAFEFDLVDEDLGVQVSYLLDAQRRAEQFDYHARTGQWMPAADIPGAYLEFGRLDDLMGDF